MKRNTLLGLSALMLTATFAAVGCSSSDRHEFISEPGRLTTVTVIKTPSQEPIWSYDVPAGYKLVVDFDANEKLGTKVPGHVIPSEMAWQLRTNGNVSAGWEGYYLGPAESSGVVAMPGTPVAMKVSFRNTDGMTTSSEVPAGDYTVSNGEATPDTTDEVQAPAVPDEATPPSEESVETPTEGDADAVKVSENVDDKALFDPE